jgi:hypothetical protein
VQAEIRIEQAIHYKEACEMAEIEDYEQKEKDYWA